MVECSLMDLMSFSSKIKTNQNIRPPVDLPNFLWTLKPYVTGKVYITIGLVQPNLLGLDLISWLPEGLHQIYNIDLHSFVMQSEKSPSHRAINSIKQD